MNECDSVCEFPLYTHICYDKDMGSVFVNITPLPPRLLRLLRTWANIMIYGGRYLSHGLKTSNLSTKSTDEYSVPIINIKLKYLVIFQF